MESEARAASVAALSSLGLHLTFVWALLTLPSAPQPLGEIELEVVSEGADPDAVDEDPHGSARTRAAPLIHGGGRSVQNVDTTSRGERGDGVGARAVILLLPHDDGITLQDSPRNSNDQAQTQRIHTASTRATREDRRATPNPHDQPWLASGTGFHPERRPLAARDPRTGARVAPSGATVGAAADVRAIAAGSPTSAAGSSPDRPGRRGGADAPHQGERGEVTAQSGASAPSPGRGIDDGQGERESEAARVAHGRPAVDEGPAATNAAIRDPRVRDDTDAELLAAQMVESWVESSQRSGTRVGDGRGGVGGGGAPGVGGAEGAGGLARPHGPGGGPYSSLDTSDARYHRWYLALKRRVLDRLSFPRARLVAMDQGLTVYRFDVSPDGRLAGPPRLLRSSGFEDFDRAALTAIVEAAPFQPLPRELSDGVERHSVRMAVEHSNPMVR
jgi:TonB family protein